MAKDIRYAVAYNENKDLVYADKSAKGQGYICPGCQNEMVLVKSEKQRKRPYFRHKALISSCTAESVLHFSFKNLLYKKIKKHINHTIPFSIVWTCSHCNSKHIGNLIKKAKEIHLEYSMGICRPDLALLDTEGKVFAVIEVVVSHFPEEHVIQHYKEHNIVPIIIKLDSEECLKLIDQSPLAIKTMNLCTTHPKCDRCKAYKMKKTLMIMDNRCNRCKANMRIAAIHSDGHKNISDFDNEDVRLAKKYDVHIKEQYSKTVGYHYLANTCKCCGAFSGNYFLEKDYIEAQNGYIPYEEVDAGFYCDICYLKDELNR